MKFMRISARDDVDLTATCAPSSAV